MADIDDVQPKREVVLRKQATLPEAKLIVTRHDISRVMFDIYKLPIHPRAKILCGNIEGMNVYLYVEEPQEAAPLMELWLRGYRDGQPITLQKPQYLCSVFEVTNRGSRDHAHVYAEAWRPGD